MNHPKSILGACFPTSRIPKGCLLIVLKSYFDASGKGDNAPFITLAGIAAHDELWREIEEDWNCRLQSGKIKAAYMHMNEAVYLKREFDSAKGWDEKTVGELINALFSDVANIPTERYCQFNCTVDMGAYRKLQAENYQMDSVVDLCNEGCVERMMQWYIREYRGLDYQAMYYFDRDEPFEPVFKAKWERELSRDEQLGTYSIWNHIRCISTLNMRTTPGLQIADMLAWGHNREATGKNTHQHIALGMRALSHTKHFTWNEAELRKRYRPLIYKP